MKFSDTGLVLDSSFARVASVQVLKQIISWNAWIDGIHPLQKNDDLTIMRDSAKVISYKCPNFTKSFTFARFMRTLVTNIFLIIFSASFGQAKSYYNVMSPKGDTTFWYKYHTTQISKLSLPSLDTVSNSKYFRIWTNKQVIEVWQNQTGTISGKLITWTDEYAPYNEKPTNRTFVEGYLLTDDTASLVDQLLLSSGILNIPTEDSIKGWQQGLDGVIYFIEYSTKDNYSFKSYWTPKAQDSLQEALQVQTFVDSSFSLVNAQNSWKSFAKTIPYECFINGGPTVICKVLTKKERKKYVKDRKKFRQHSITKSRADE